MMCADVPQSPQAPTLLVNTLDLILLEWDPPADDGGSPILGYAILMKTQDMTDLLMVYNGTQNPSTRSLALTEFNDAPLEKTEYVIIVRAYNWVGESYDTQLSFATVIITVRTNAETSLIFGDPFELDGGGALTGVASIKAAVPALVYLQARDDIGVDLTNGGSNIFVQIEELCTVTDNYRCDRVPDTPDVLEGT